MERQAENTALICATVFNAQRTEKRQKVWTVDDFLSRPKKKQKQAAGDMPASLTRFKSSPRVKPKATTNGKPG